MPLLFVYGTLMSGASNHREMAGQRCLGPARTGPGWTLIRLDGYPGLIVDATAEAGVTGEVWEVDDEARARLDAFEGVDEGLYRRAPIALAEGPAGLPPTVETYLYARPHRGEPVLGPTWRDD